MLKRVFFSLLLLLTTFSCLGLANGVQVTHYRIKFTVNRPFMLEPNATLAVPAGEYWVKDMETAPGHLLSLERGTDFKHMAWLTTVRIDRSLINWSDHPTVTFDYESAPLPVIKEFLIPDTDGYQILHVKYNKGVAFLDVATLTRAKYTITEQRIQEEAAPVKTAPAPVEEAPAVEQTHERRQEEVAPAAEPVKPVRERKRVRKD